MKLTGIYIFILLLMLAGCTESTTVGGEILDQDQSALQSVDTFTVRTATVTEDDLVIFSPTTRFNNMLCGHFEDPVFGTVKADLYAQFRITENAIPVFPAEAVFDSVVLLLEYDLGGIYGDATEEQEFEIFQITNNTINEDSAYVSGNELPVEMPSLTTIQFTPDLEEETVIVAIDSSGTIRDTTFATINPFLSIRLDDLITVLADINTDNNDQNNDDFVANFGGLAIKPVGGPTESMLSFAVTALRSGLQLYYHVGEGDDKESRSYEYNITTASVRFSSFDNEPDTDITEAEVNGFEAGKELTYMQGMNGPNTVLQLPYITDFRDEVLVNFAELAVTVQNTPGSDTYDPVEQIIILYKNEDGNFVTIDDFLFTANGVGIGAFGGQVEDFTGSNGEMLSRYRMKIAGHLQRMIDGEAPKEIYLRVFRKNERANRVVLYGSDHSQYPVTLKANFTNLN